MEAKYPLQSSQIQLTSNMYNGREPLLSWAPKTPAEHGPVDYFVPDFGVDHEIAATHKNE